MNRRCCSIIRNAGSIIDWGQMFRSRVIGVLPMGRLICCAALSCFAVSADAAELLLSVGIRQVDAASEDIGSNGGSSGGIAWINRDELSIVDDGEWHLFEFFPFEDPVVQFTDPAAEVEFATLEHIRILNTEDGVNSYRLWIDDVRNTNFDDSDIQVAGFEDGEIDSEYMFQEPGFSGSTSGNLNTGQFNASVVADGMAFEGTQSNRVEFEFVDDQPTRWVRLTTFNGARLPNPLLYVGPGSVISFQAKLETVSTFHPCDLTQDGSIDAADAGMMFGNWGNSGVGDCNNDGMVDAADAGEMFAAWTGDGTTIATQVPEPSNGLLLVASLLLCGRGRWLGASLRARR